MPLLAIRSSADLPFKKRLRCCVGRVLLKLLPARAAKVRADLFSAGWGGVDKLIRNGLFHRALIDKDHDTLREFLVNYWSSEEGKAFHDDFRSRFETHFLENASRATDDFEDYLKAAKPPIDKIYEIGCGSGQVLEYLADRFPPFARFTGLDLSARQIEENRETYKERPALEFVAGDVCEWLPAHGSPGSLVLTNGGVLEYVDQPRLEALLAHIAVEMAPASLIVVETLANDHDLEIENDSLVYGREMSFSHNYPYLIERSGMSIRFREEWIAEDGCRWIFIHATVSPAS
jgi:SAM-dependent methyltransferase